MPTSYPPAAFDRAALVIAVLPAGHAVWRIYGAIYADRLGTGYGKSRWSVRWRLRKKKYKLLYGAAQLTDCFAETVLRDHSDGVVGPFQMRESELSDWQAAHIRLREPLRVADLTGGKIKQIGMPSDALRGTNQAAGREWGWALHQHPDRIDGILYPSRHTTGICLCVFERAHAKLEDGKGHPMLLRDAGAGLIDILQTFDIALLP